MDSPTLDSGGEWQIVGNQPSEPQDFAAVAAESPWLQQWESGAVDRRPIAATPVVQFEPQIPRPQPLAVNSFPPSQDDHSKTAARILILKEPEEQHRARYLSEGSRGAIKDRSGKSHCTVQMTGYYRPTRVEMFAANGAGDLTPHPLYKLIPVAGKTAITTPCKKITAHDGIECLEIKLRPETNMTAILDCMGILKICSYDAKQQRRPRRTANNSTTIKRSRSPDTESLTTASTCTRICFRAYVLDESKSSVAVVEACTEPIRCVQQLGVPEVLKMSLNSAPTRGGMDLFIIGRNFDRNTAVLFREYTDDGTLCWSAEATIAKSYFHQCHIVCTVPQYPNQYRGGTVSVTVRCGQKFSHPSTFVFLPSDEDPAEEEWCPPSSSPRLETPRNRRIWVPPTNTAMNYFGEFPEESPHYTPVPETSKYSQMSYYGFDSETRPFSAYRSDESSKRPRTEF